MIFFFDGARVLISRLSLLFNLAAGARAEDNNKSKYFSR